MLWPRLPLQVHRPERAPHLPIPPLQLRHAMPLRMPCRAQRPVHRTPAPQRAPRRIRRPPAPLSRLPALIPFWLRRRHHHPRRIRLKPHHPLHAPRPCSPPLPTRPPLPLRPRDLQRIPVLPLRSRHHQKRRHRSEHRHHRSQRPSFPFRIHATKFRKSGSNPAAPPPHVSTPD